MVDVNRVASVADRGIVATTNVQMQVDDERSGGRWSLHLGKAWMYIRRFFDVEDPPILTDCTAAAARFCEGRPEKRGQQHFSPLQRDSISSLSKVSFAL